MLEGCKTAKERWGGVHQLIDRWIGERHELVLLYMAANGIEDFKRQSEASMQVKVKALCQVLVDYISAGHFEIYEQLLQEAKAFDDGSEEIVRQVLPQLEENTQRLLDFNDKYQTDAECAQNEEFLDEDLAKLGEDLEARFELEDRLIEDIHQAHENLVA